MSRLQIVLVLAALAGTAAAEDKIGINILLDRAPSESVLAELGKHGKVLDVIPEINAVTLSAEESALDAIQALDCVESATPDVECELAGSDGLPVPDLSGGASHWGLDAINVTDHGEGRTVDYDGEGVYVAVLDTGLPPNWRAYFPEERIATDFARSFCGGGGQAATISSQPEKWASDTAGHGTEVTSVILGFAYSGGDEELPEYFNGVAPKATVIPVKVGTGGQNGNRGDNRSGRWESLIAHSIVYVTNLKVDGDLGDAPLVINLSSGLHRPLPLQRAAIGYAIANGVIVVAGAGNEANTGMRFPAAYPEVISVAGASWVDQFVDDETTARWAVGDVPEDDVTEFHIWPRSSREKSGQELDLAAPTIVPAAWTVDGNADYTFFDGTSAACPHVAGVVALMLQKNPGLTQADVETILEDSALPMSPGTVTIVWAGVDSGNLPTWDDHDNVFFTELTTSWGADATGSGLLQADAALAATPDPE